MAAKESADISKLKKAIEKYFKSINGKPLYDDNGNAVLLKDGTPIIIGEKPPTLSGLALAIGLTSRSELQLIKPENEYNRIIVKARSRCEEYAEQQLYDKNSVNGAKFMLSESFEGWGDKPSKNANEPLSVNVELLEDE